MTTILPRQPDDPGLHADNPYAPVRFEDSEMGRSVAFLGSKMVGQVIPMWGGKLCKAHALMNLPDVPRKLMPATSVERAKEAVAETVRQWIYEAGLRA